jgi:MFS family permease
MSIDTSPPPAGVEAPPPAERAAPAAAPAGRAGRPRRFAALQHRDYRLYWFGNLVSLLGTQMSGVAIGWQIYQMTRDPLMLGLTGLFTVVPLVLFSLYGGVVADALDRRRLLLVTQAVLLGVSIVLAVTTLTGLISVWIIFAVAAVQGAVQAFNNPARAALIPNLVPREHLTNAISLGVTSWQVAAVVGPATAGLLIGAASHVFGPTGISVVYLIDALSFLGVIGALWLMRTRAQEAETREISLAAALEGLRFVFRSPIMRGTMLLDFFATFFGASLLLMPVFAADVLHVGPEGLGFLLAAPSTGAVVTAAVLASFGQVRRQGLVVLWSVAAYGLAWIVFGLTRNFWVALLALAGTGAADTVSMVMRQTIRQLITPDALRGRMTSVNMIFFMGGPQLGEFEGGIVARLWGAPVAAISGGIGVLLATAFVALGMPSVREYEAE